MSEIEKYPEPVDGIGVKIVMGHNRPPDMTETAKETMAALSKWMEEHPVIGSEEDAKEAKVYIDRGRLCIKDVEAERDGLVRPLNTKVKEINEHYRGSRETLQKILNEIEGRITIFLREEERKRQEIAEAARLAAEAAESRAREAEAVERERIESARSGELGVDIAEATSVADSLFSEHERASRFAARADRDTKVKVGGGFSRAISLKTVETLVVIDAYAAMRDMGVTDDIRDAILKSARAYRKVFEELPAGIEIQTERKV